MGFLVTEDTTRWARNQAPSEPVRGPTLLMNSKQNEHLDVKRSLRSPRELPVWGNGRAPRHGQVARLGTIDTERGSMPGAGVRCRGQSSLMNTRHKSTYCTNAIMDNASLVQSARQQIKDEGHEFDNEHSHSCTKPSKTWNRTCKITNISQLIFYASFPWYICSICSTTLLLGACATTYTV